MKNDLFLDNAIPRFFELKLYCQSLTDILNLKKGVPTDPKIRHARSATAVLAKNHGEEELKAMILVFLYCQKTTTMYSSIEKLCEGLGFGFDHVLKIYNDLRKNSVDEEGPALNFASNLKPENFIKILHKWKSDPEFKAQLSKLCIIR